MTATPALTVERTLGGYCVRVVGRGTMRESPAFHLLAVQTLENTEETLVLDLAACDYLDSTFLGCLAGLAKRYGLDRPSRLTLARPSPSCRRLLASMHLDLLLELVEEPPPGIGESLAIPVQELTSEALGEHILECHRRLAELGGRQAEIFAPVVNRLAADLARRQGEPVHPGAQPQAG